jgi:hypothetical protein
VTGWSGDRFYGGRLADLGVIDMGVDLEDGGNVADTSDFDFTLLNHDDYHTTLQSYNLYNRRIDVRLVFADQSSPSWSNAVECFSGIVYDWDFDEEYITIECTSKDKKFHKEIPETIISADDFPNCPVENIGKRVPLVWGSFSGPNSTYQYGGKLIKALLVDEYERAYVTMDHIAESNGDPHYWDQDLKQFCPISGSTETDGSSQGYLVSYKNYHIITDPRVTKKSRGYKVPTSAGHDFSDAEKLFDFDTGTYLTMSKSTAADVAMFLLKDFFVGDEALVRLKYGADWSATPSGDAVDIEVYENNFGNKIATINSVADSTFSTSSHIITSAWLGSSKHAMGIKAVFDDGGDDFSVQLQQILIEAANVLLEQTPSVIYSTTKGRNFGSWIDASRSNGYNQYDLVRNPGYVIESLFRDLLGLATSDIDVSSFDDVGTVPGGDRNGWYLDGQIENPIDSRRVIKDMCRQTGMIVFERCNGETTVKAIDLSETPAGTIGGSTILIDPDTKESTLKRRLTPLEKVFNDVEILYNFNPATGSYEDKVYCNKDGKTSGVATGYDTKCSNSYTKYGIERKLVVEANWIRDAGTAYDLCEFLVDFFVNRHEIVTFDTMLWHIDKEIGDVYTIDNGFVDNVYMLTRVRHHVGGDRLTLEWFSL